MISVDGFILVSDALIMRAWRGMSWQCCALVHGIGGGVRTPYGSDPEKIFSGPVRSRVSCVGREIPAWLTYPGIFGMKY